MLALDGRAGPRTHRITCPAPTLEEGGSAMVRAAALGCALLLTIGLLPVAAQAQTKEDTLVYALQSDIDTWDPPGSVLREAIILGYHVFDHLAVRDLKTRKVIPNLAISWKTIDDTTWEVKLRQGVKFHDGTPFTSKDVKATFDRVLDPVKKMIARGNHAKIKTVEIVDDYTVRFKTDGPYPLFVERMTAQVMESEKVIREKGDEWMQEHPVGTGPYKLVKWARKQEHLLVRNDDYWGPKPYYKYVRVRIIPEQATQIAELLPNGVDVLFNEAPPTVEPGTQQTNDAIVADMTKAGFRVKRNYIGDNTVVVARAKEGKLGPMMNWSWGYYSVFDTDAILYDMFKCGEFYSYYCNKELDDLIISGRSTLDQKRRAEIYVKAQKLMFDDAAALFKWGLRGVWGVSNRIEYWAPPDEVDRMFLATPRKK